MRFFPAAALAACLLSALAAPAAFAEGRSIIVLDGSGSMWGQIDGRPKLEIAREALAEVLAGIPAETEIGLMAYGHRSKGDCGDIELIVPPGQGTAAAITDAANKMKFLGKTPLTEAVRQAAADLRSTEEKATVILITDGIETCEADPCALGTELEQSGVDFTAHVVGFGLSAEEGRAVACLAENTGGKYIEAADAGALVAALETAVAEPEPAPEPEPEPEPAPAVLEQNIDPALLLAPGAPELTGDFVQAAVFEFLPLDAAGNPGEIAETIYSADPGHVTPGSYVMRTTLHNVVVEQKVEISDTALATPQVVLDAGILAIRILAEEGGAPAEGALWEMNGAGGVSDVGYTESIRVFPAGEYELSTALGEMSAKEALVITAGETLDKTVILGVGVPVFQAYYAPGVPVEGDQAFEIHTPGSGGESLGPHVRTDYGAGAAPQLPPGDYVVVASSGEARVEMPFTVKPGQRSEVAVVLNAGIAAIEVPNATALEIVEAKVGLDGRRRHIRTEYGETAQVTLPAGDYVLLITSGEASSETPFTIKPAERTEVKSAIAVGMAVVSAPDADEVEIFEAKVALDGKRKSVRHDYGDRMEGLIPPGDYVAVATAGAAEAEVAFTVKDGERSEITVIIPHGYAVASAPGAKAVSILAARAGLDGKREVIRHEYGEATEIKVPPGDYVAFAEYEDDITAEQPLSVADGQRVEVVVQKP